METYFNIIEDCVQKHNTNPYALITFIGSGNKSHDIDMLWISNGTLKPGEFLINQSDLVKKIMKELKQEGIKLVPFTKLCYQDEVAYLSKWKKGRDIMLHNLVYIDNQSFERFNPPNFKKEAKKNAIMLKGDFDNLNNIPQEEAELTYLYFTLINANLPFMDDYPIELRKQKEKHIINYINKWSGIKPSNWKECVTSLDKRIAANA